MVASTGDTTPPTIMNCPMDINLALPVGQTTGQVFWTEPTATDNDGQMPLQSSTHLPGEGFPSGTTQVTYTFLDQALNPSICTFNVILTGKAIIK